MYCTAIKSHKAPDPQEERKRLALEYYRKYCNPSRAAELGIVNDIIDPADTRLFLTDALRLLKNKKRIALPKKHGNIPL